MEGTKSIHNIGEKESEDLTSVNDLRRRGNAPGQTLWDKSADGVPGARFLLPSDADFSLPALRRASHG